MNDREEKIKNLTEGSPWRLLFLFSLPLMAGNVFQQLYTVVDTAVVGKVLGVEALAALGAVECLNWMIPAMIQGFTQGFSILMAQKFGANEYKNLRQTVTNAIFISIICAVLITATGQGMAVMILDFMQTPKEIQSISLAYLRILLAGVPIVVAYNLGACILRALGNSSTPLVAMVIASITNILLDFWFVIGLEWGVQGAALATVIAQSISAIYCFLHISKIKILYLYREDWKLETALCIHLMKLGMPMAFQNIVIAVSSMIVQIIVNGFGVLFLAGFTATNKLYGLLEAAAISYGYAITTYTGQNLGAGKIRRVSQGLRSIVMISFGTSLAITTVMIVFGKNILSLFIASGTEQGIQALEIGFRYLVILAVSLPVLYLLHVVRSCIQGLGNTMLPMVSGVAEFIMRTGAAFLLPGVLGQNGILYAEVLAWIGADIILVPSYCHVMKRIKKNRYREVDDIL